MNRLEAACREIDLPQIKSILLEAVDGFEPKEEVSDQLWDLYYSRSDAKEEPAGEETKVTPLFKD